MLLTHKQAKKISKIAIKKKKKAYTVIQKPLKISKISIRIYKKVFKGLNLKEKTKVQLLIKNFKNKKPSQKVGYIKIGLFKIISKSRKLYIGQTYY